MIILVQGFSAVQEYLFSAGSNENGKLGLNKTSSVLPSSPVWQMVTEFTHKPLSSVHLGEKHGFAVDKDGRLYGWGSNHDNELGLNDEGGDSKIDYQPYPVEIPFFKNTKVRYADGGTGRSIVLTLNNTLYAMGINSFGGKGQSVRAVDVSELGNETILNAHIYSGTAYILTDAGNVFAFGSCTGGQCGNIHGTRQTPVKIHLNDLHVTHIWAGSDALFFRDSENDTYAIGTDEYGELCTTFTHVDVPHRIHLKNITQVSPSKEHTLFLDENGVLYGCGKGDDGRLGENVSETVNVEPVRINTNYGKIQSIGTTRDGSMILTTTGLYVTGKDNYGELGDGGTKRPIHGFHRPITSFDFATADKIAAHDDFAFIYASIVVRNKEGLTGGAVAGIVIGTLILVCAAGVGIFFLVKCINRR